jgi:cytochrome c biogenesis protein ResB
MKSMIVIGLMVALSGCALVRQTPSEAKARRLEEGRSAAEREAHARADAKKLEDQGLTSREARSLAEAQRQAARP